MFSFDDYSLAALSTSLKRLELQNCKIDDSKQLFYLEQCIYLDLQDNKIKDYEELSPFLSTMHWLKELRLKGNPISNEKKFRDMIILFN